MTHDRADTQQDLQAKTLAQAGVVVVLALIALATSGCASKNYVRSQTGPLVQQTNELDAKTAADHRAIGDTDARAQSGIANAQSAADTANQHADSAGQAANSASQSAQEAYNRVDTLSGVVANLDNYKPVSDITVTFATNKYVLTASDRKQLDDFAATLQNTRGYLLEVTGGTDSTGDAQYNYQLSQKRADAVVNYLATKYNVPPHKFYLIGIGKDVQVATDKTSAGRAKNRRVQVKLMTNMGQPPTPGTTSPSGL
jgi:outer membrane protein OmpA-like peptidoglycan-associated protein